MRQLLPVLLLLAALVGAKTSSAEDVPDAASEDGASKNTAYVRDEAPVLRRVLELTTEAEAAEDWGTWVRAWQMLVDLEEDAEVPGAAAPYVLPVRGTTVFEGAARVAHQRIVEAGAPALEAYAREFGALARKRVAEAAATSRREALEEVATRFLPLPEGRRAALLLADLAHEAGDLDGALAWLQRLEDLEEVTAEPQAALAPWREARIRRMAAVLAVEGKIEDAATFLRDAAAEDETFAVLPPRLRRPVEPVADWTTTGGGPDRAALAPRVGKVLAPAWFGNLGDGPLDELVPGRLPPARPSPWLPPRAVSDGTFVFVSNGALLQVWDGKHGKRAAEAVALEDRHGEVLWSYGEDAVRERFGLLEGHAMTLGPMTRRGRLLYVAAPETTALGEHWGYRTEREDRLEAFLFDGRRLRRVWRIGGAVGRAGMPDATRLYGAPLLYRGRLWISGIRATRGSSDQAEAWLFGLDPWTGAVEVKTWLGGGAPVRIGRADEAIPTSPAGRAGRVVVGTALGVLAAVDARDGRVAWALRYERGVVSRGRTRRLGESRDGSARQSGFKNEPPLLALEGVFAAPTDAPHVLFLFDRPRGRSRALVKWRLHRRFDFQHFAVEQLAGLHPGSAASGPRLILVGKGVSPEGDVPAPMVVAVDALHPDRGPLWRGISTTGHGAEPFGRALVTEREVIVPTAHGLVVYDVLNGRDLSTADQSLVPRGWRDDMPPGATLFGNVIPAPGGGLLTANDRVVAAWRKP